MPATTRCWRTQKATNWRVARSPPNHQAVAGGGQPRILHANVVLVGEEVREPLIAGEAAEHATGRDRPLAQRGGPVPDAEAGLEVGVPGGGDVAGRVDAGRDGLQPLIDQHAVPKGEPGRLRQLGPRGGADPDQYQVAGQGPPVAGDDGFDVAVAAEGIDACPEL